MENMLSAARAYCRRAWSVIPLVAGQKRPMAPWAKFQERPASEEQVREWFDLKPDANIGIVTGSVSGLIVLDIDPGHGGNEGLQALEAEHARLPKTVEATTGGGGRHIYFLHPGDTLRSAVGIRSGIDLRADGGMVVVPPSLHPSGRPYVWKPHHSPEELPLAPLPQWLKTLLRDRSDRHGHPLSHWRDLVVAGVAEGNRNNTIASLSGHLLWHDVDPSVVLELMLCWNRARCRPPLADEEVAEVVKSIERLHGSRPLQSN